MFFIPNDPHQHTANYILHKLILSLLFSLITKTARDVTLFYRWLTITVRHILYSSHSSISYNGCLVCGADSVVQRMWFDPTCCLFFQLPTPTYHQHMRRRAYQNEVPLIPPAQIAVFSLSRSKIVTSFLLSNWRRSDSVKSANFRLLVHSDFLLLPPTLIWVVAWSGWTSFIVPFPIL